MRERREGRKEGREIKREEKKEGGLVKGSKEKLQFEFIFHLILQRRGH